MTDSTEYPHRYFVSFACGPGRFGNATVSLRFPVRNEDDVALLKSMVEEQIGDRTQPVVILNFVAFEDTA